MNKQHNSACRYRNVRREHFETWPLNLEISYSVHGLKQNILRRALYETQALCPCEILVLSNLCCNCLLRNYTPVSRCNCLKLIQLIMKTSGTYKLRGLRKLVDVVLRSFWNYEFAWDLYTTLQMYLMERNLSTLKRGLNTDQSSEYNFES